MAEFKMTIGDKTVEASGLDATQVFALLKEVVMSQLEIAVTYDHLQPVTVNFPTSEENLLEPGERELVENMTPHKSKGSIVPCRVSCPKCEHEYERELMIGDTLKCDNCKTAIFYEPSTNGYFKAEKPLVRKY
jgi:hypothetical protein